MDDLRREKSNHCTRLSLLDTEHTQAPHERLQALPVVLSAMLGALGKKVLLFPAGTAAMLPHSVYKESLFCSRDLVQLCLSFVSLP